MPFMTRIPSDLAKFGLKVELVPGWETRGSSSFAPASVVDHWTAGPKGTTGRPSLAIVTNGRPDLEGPLCNVYLDRKGVCVVVAAGRANHAGPGGFRGLVGNSAAYGIEAESGGDGDWTPEQLVAYPRLNAALLAGLGRDGSWVCGHNEWAPDRKIDIRDIIQKVRSNTVAVLANPQEEDMPTPDELVTYEWYGKKFRGEANFAQVIQGMDDALVAVRDRDDVAPILDFLQNTTGADLRLLVAQQRQLQATVDALVQTLAEVIATKNNVDVDAIVQKLEGVTFKLDAQG